MQPEATLCQAINEKFLDLAIRAQLFSCLERRSSLLVLEVTQPDTGV